MSLISNRLNVAQRLFLAFGAMTAILVAGNLLSYSSATAVLDLTRDALSDALASQDMARELQKASMTEELRIRQLGLLVDMTEAKNEVEGMQRSRKQGDLAFATLVRLGVSPDEKEVLKQMDALRHLRAPVVDKVLHVMEDLQTDNALTIISQELEPLSRQQTVLMDRIVSLQKTRADKAIQLAIMQAHRSQIVTVLVSVIGLAFASTCGFLMARGITKRLRIAVEAADRVAQGDLRIATEEQPRDEIGSLMVALSRMADRMRSTLATVRDSSEAIRVASADIALGNEELSSRTEAQAASLEQTASTLTEMTDRLQLNAEAAKRASTQSQHAADLALKAGGQVTEIVQTMAGIASLSGRIGDIVGVIDGIAFQTNILALNAAVEAAQAGDHGRGFAVVAGEVRTLAKRSADAAKEIKALVEENLVAVRGGLNKVERAGTVMGDLVEMSGSVAETVDHISQANSEQATGVAEISLVVTELDRTTQKNAALVEQAFSTSMQLSEQTVALTEAMQRFQLDEELTPVSPS